MKLSSKKSLVAMLFVPVALSVNAATSFVATNGVDSSAGTIAKAMHCGGCRGAAIIGASSENMQLIRQFEVK